MNHRPENQEKGGIITQLTIVLPLILIIGLGSFELWRWIDINAAARDAVRLIAVSAYQECTWSADKATCLQEDLSFLERSLRLDNPSIRLVVSFWSDQGGTCQLNARATTNGASTQITLNSELNRICSQHGTLILSEASIKLPNFISGITSFLHPSNQYAYAVNSI